MPPSRREDQLVARFTLDTLRYMCYIRFILETGVFKRDVSISVAERVANGSKKILDTRRNGDILRAFKQYFSQESRFPCSSGSNSLLSGPRRLAVLLPNLGT